MLARHFLPSLTAYTRSSLSRLALPHSDHPLSKERAEDELSVNAHSTSCSTMASLYCMHLSEPLNWAILFTSVVIWECVWHATTPRASDAFWVPDRALISSNYFHLRSRLANSSLCSTLVLKLLAACQRRSVYVHRLSTGSNSYAWSVCCCFRASIKPQRPQCLSVEPAVSVPPTDINVLLLAQDSPSLRTHLHGFEFYQEFARPPCQWV